MEVQKDEEQELEVKDDDQVAYEGNSQRFYSKEALRRAESVKETQAKCGKFSLRKLYEAFLSGAITNTEGYTKSQIMTADEILGSDVDYLKGVYTEKQQFKGTEGEPNPNEVVLQADLIFDENLTMLICIAIPTLWTVLLQLKDKTAEVILAAIEKVIAVFKFMGKKVTMIFVDGEAGVDSPKTKDRLFVKHDAIVDSSGKKRHTIQTLDRKIRTIKDHVRAIRSMVPFAVGGTMLLALFLQMTNIVNIMPTKGNNNGMSPFQAILGRNARLNDICPHKPLETVLIAKHNDVTNRTSNQNVVEAIFLFASNIHTTSKSKPEFSYLTVDTLEVITRGEGTPFRIKDFHIDKINRL